MIKKVFSAAMAIALSVMASGCSIFNSGGGIDTGYITSQPFLVFKTAYGTYAGCVNLAYESVDCSDMADRNKILLIDDDFGVDCLLRTAQDGNTFYGWFDNDYFSDLFRISAVDEKTTEKTVWVSKAQLAESCLSPNHSLDRPITLQNFLADGDSVYATLGFNLEYMHSQIEINGRIARIGKDGKSIDFVGDDSVRAEEFVVNGGWIYYLDNGYKVDGGSFEYDDGKVGIYKIKTDGTEKTLLRGGAVFDGSYVQKSADMASLSIYKDHLYFLDLNNGSRLCRIKTDGSGYEQLSTSGACVYTIDTQTDTLYFETGSLAAQNKEQRRICCMSEKDRAEKTVYDTSMTINLMDFSEGYLYYYSYLSSYPGELITCRVNTATGKAQSLEYRREDVKYEYDEDGNMKPVGTPKSTIQWYDANNE